MDKTGPVSQNLNAPASLHGFKLYKVQPIPELHSTAYLFTHEQTGANVIHLFNDDPNNLFSIAFRTPVQNSTGVPHILEHSVLCGSNKFPVKDPFQELLKGSLQTFLNALTYPDKTIYPVSSQVEKDFYNLVDVYCDAVFNPLLSENTFYQEGWHFDVEDMSKPIGIKGIVYNEMKGVYSNFSSHVERRTLSALFPDTTYFFESGGDPEKIPELTYEQFRNFHARYYHPSNSFVFLYGNIPSEKSLAFLNDNYLSKFQKIKIDSEVQVQPLWSEPKSLTIEAPAPKEDDGTSTIAMVWIFGPSTDPVLMLAGRVITHYLLGTESSPLKRALIDSGLGEDLDDISGFETDLVQSVFAAGIRKSKPENTQKVKELILDTLESQVRGGLDKELLEGAIRQIEFALREVTGAHFPYNLRLAERCYRSWVYGGDPLAHLAFEAPLSIIKQEHAKGQQFFINLIRERLLENSHHLLATIVASSEMGKKLEQQTEKQSHSLTANFDSARKQACYELTQNLVDQQKKPSPAEALEKLPKLFKSDLPGKGRDIPTNIAEKAGVTIHEHPIFTSGIVYLDLGFDLRAVPQNLLPYIPIYLELLTRCGAAGMNYEQMATRTALSTGGIDSSVSCKTRIGTSDELLFYSFFHGKSLVPRFGEMLDIFKDIIIEPDLDNRKQIKDILLEERNSLNSSIISSGNYFALTRAASYLSKSRAVDEVLGGIEQLRFLDDLVENEKIDLIIKSIKELHSIIINRNAAIVSLTVDNPSSLEHQLGEFLDKLPSFQINPAQYNFPFSKKTQSLGIEISSAVNFVAKVWKLSSADPAGSGLLYLMSRNLSTGYLWDKVRVEGGAYGGSAMMSISHPIFACSSYRDPNLKSTLDHFESGLKEVVSGISQDKVDQSIIGTIGRIDMPLPPHSQGLGETMDLMLGNTPDFRQKLREAVLEADSRKVKETAQMVLGCKDTMITVLGSAAAFDAAGSQGVGFLREPLLH
jgi:Zn-dependent M16 (insulinase) family peptidase